MPIPPEFAGTVDNLCTGRIDAESECVPSVYFI
jgi:hypothetical protein